MRSGETEKAVADGDTIVRVGDAGAEMYVIKTGRVRISRPMAGRDVVLSELGPGDFFGEMSLLESLPRDADAVAVGETRLLVLNAGSLLVRLRRDPTFALEMLHRLSGRVRTLNAELEKALSDAATDSATELPS
ncbi:MAG TPA: cyclic nucleotide-binding domain-containing protein [Acidimicrobiales bacterium]|nr:cyclic nucleotide-binding domain-containing protein [Acidimicrobiales bacterium]